MQVNPKTRLVVSSNQVSASVSPGEVGEVVVLGLKDGVYFELKDVGAQIWHLIQVPTSIEAIVTSLLDEYDVTREQCEADVVAIATELVDRELAEIEDAQDL